MAINVTFEIKGWGRLSRRIEWINKSIDDLSPFFKKVADMVDKKIDKVFSSQGSVLKGKKRSSLSKQTVQARMNRQWHYKLPPNNPSTLRWTWNLQNNRTKKHDRKSAQITFNAPYAVYHHFGKWRMKRRLVQLDQQLNQEIMRVLVTEINKTHGIANIRS